MMVAWTRSSLPASFCARPQTRWVRPASRFLNVTCVFLALGVFVLPLPVAPPSGLRWTMYPSAALVHRVVRQVVSEERHAGGEQLEGERHGVEWKVVPGTEVVAVDAQ